MGLQQIGTLFLNLSTSIENASDGKCIQRHVIFRPELETKFSFLDAVLGILWNYRYIEFPLFIQQ